MRIESPAGLASWVEELDDRRRSGRRPHGGRMLSYHHGGLCRGLLCCLLPGVPLIQKRRAAEDAKRHERNKDDGCGTSGHLKARPVRQSAR